MIGPRYTIIEEPEDDGRVIDRMIDAGLDQCMMCDAPIGIGEDVVLGTVEVDDVSSERHRQGKTLQLKLLLCPACGNAEDYDERAAELAFDAYLRMTAAERN